jgi:hypothetical protein
MITAPWKTENRGKLISYPQKERLSLPDTAICQVVGAFQVISID